MISLNLKRIIAKKPRILNLFQLGRGWAPFPLFYLVHLTLACNANCEFCYQKRGEWSGFSKDFLAVGDFEEILKQAKMFIFKRPLIYFFGGEPLLHPQFVDFLELVEKFRYPSSLTTNGILLGKYLKPIGAARHLNQLTVSLHGVGKIHDNLIGRVGVFQEIVSAIHRLKEWAPKKVINITCVITRENKDKLLDLANFLDKSLFGKISALVFRYPMTNAFLLESKNNHFSEVIEKIRKIKFSFPVFFTAEDWLGVKRGKGYLSEGNCNLPWLGLGILPNLDILSGGSVLTCSQPLGNLKQNSLKEIWNGERLRDLRKRILKSGLPLTCQGCCHAQL